MYFLEINRGDIKVIEGVDILLRDQHPTVWVGAKNYVDIMSDIMI